MCVCRSQTAAGFFDQFPAKKQVEPGVVDVETTLASSSALHTEGASSGASGPRTPPSVVPAAQSDPVVPGFATEPPGPALAAPPSRDSQVDLKALVEQIDGNVDGFAALTKENVAMLEEQFG